MGIALRLQGAGARHPAASPGARPALAPLDLRIEPGEAVAVIGPSGAGKTSLLHLLACALRPAEGRYWLGEAEPWQLPRRQLQRLRGQLLLAPQTPPLPPRQRVITALTAARLPALGFWASLGQLVRPGALEQAHAALERFGLADKLFERVDRLSGGERQRVGLARALLAPARLWLVDEPLSALDPTRSQQALDTLVGLARERGVTLVASLHQVDLALSRFPRVLGLREGRLMFDLPSNAVGAERLAQLYAQHEHELQAAAPLPAEILSPRLPVAGRC